MGKKPRGGPAWALYKSWKAHGFRVDFFDALPKEDQDKLTEYVKRVYE